MNATNRLAINGWFVRLAKGALLPLFVAACGQATNLTPAPGTQPAPSGVGSGAVASSAGVEIEARAGAWRGVPQTLEQEVTPLLVTITNNSDQPMLIRYSAFRLSGVNGKQFGAMPPFDIDEEVTETITVDAFPYTGFTVAPYLRRYYPRLTAADAFLLDRAFYSRMVPVFRTIRLPTGDMVQKALPEGVLAPGSRVAGFLYFEDLDDDVANVTFTADLLNASTQASFGNISIPFTAS